MEKLDSVVLSTSSSDSCGPSVSSKSFGCPPSPKKKHAERRTTHIAEIAQACGRSRSQTQRRTTPSKNGIADVSDPLLKDSRD